MFERVLLCYDGSATARKALKRGAELAILVNAKVYVLSVVDTIAKHALTVAGTVGQPCLMDQVAEHDESLRESVAWLQERGVKAEGHIGHGRTIDVIAEHAARLSVDLVVVGHYPESERGRWWSGPERAALADRVRCCILIAVND
jgi:nucleotide-binding universal stress UspA family protein